MARRAEASHLFFSAAAEGLALLSLRPKETMKQEGQPKLTYGAIA
ncbi:MAG TPA: hypothetical protein VFA26_21625 [Gemmataceae bacterium]|nr:hypothetical protein [Gemmataceae bacterium]